MKYMAIFADIFEMDIDVEIMMFLCSLMLYFILQSARKAHMEKMCSNPKHMSKMRVEVDDNQNASDNQDISADARNERYAQLDKSLHVAFEAADYWQVLKCWYALKKFKQCPPIHLSQIVKSMQCCNKAAHVIVAEVRDYLKAYPQKKSICLVNDILEPLARRHDDSQLVDQIVRMLPSIKLVKDSRTYEILLTMHVARQELTKAQDLISEMRTNETAFTPCATVAVMTMALQLKNADVALKAFSKLKVAWDVRSTWAVSPFALQRHKTNILTQIVELACQKKKLGQVLLMLEGMTVPEDVMNVVQKECASLSEIELVTMFKLLSMSGRAQAKDSICNMLINRLDSRSQALLRSAPKKTAREVSSDASTSEGSRSDSEAGEEESCFSGFRAPPGLPQPGF